MNSDNPYAAPQTVQMIARRADDLPAAEQLHGVPSNMFAEVSTLSLERIKAASNAIQRMTNFWAIAMGVLLLGVVSLIVEQELVLGIPLLLLAGFVLALRVYAGFVRGRNWRYFSLAIDLLPILLVLLDLMILLFLPVNSVWLGVSILLLPGILFSVFPFASVMAHLKYDCLFGDERYLQEDLTVELMHRWKYQIQ